MRYFICLCLTLCLIACTNSHKNTILEIDKTELEILKSKVIKLEKEKDSLQKIIIDKQRYENRWFGAMESKPYKELGVLNPKEYILKALKEEINIFPVEAVLGGRMYFTDIEILSTKWLIASYEDGHIMARSIFSYNLHPETLKVEFKELATVLDY